MREAASVEDLEAAWMSFLSELNKVWTKVDLVCRARPRFHAWQYPWREERQRDELLSYLQHARNAQTHTLVDPLARRPGLMRIGGDGPVAIRSLEILTDGRVVFDGEGTLRLEFEPGRIEVLPVVDRGRTYGPPSAHLGASFSTRNPIAVASAGLAYYSRLVEAAEAEFFPPAA